jgi:hypothetical protein
MRIKALLRCREWWRLWLCDMDPECDEGHSVKKYIKQLDNLPNYGSPQHLPEKRLAEQRVDCGRRLSSCLIYFFTL